MSELDDLAAEVDEVPARALRRRRAWLVPALIAAVLLALGLLALGVYLGWRAAAHAAVVEPEPKVVTIAADPYSGKTGIEMPDVRGLPKQDALTALSDAGIPARLITVTTVPWAGTTGLVVDQNPLFGSTNPSSVSIRIAAPTVVPNLVGSSEDAALNTLGGLGARVDVTRRYVPGTPAGQVLAISPKPGSAVPAAVKVTVSEDAGGIYLGQVRPLDGSCSHDIQTVTVNGVDYSNAAICSTGSSDYPAAATYDLRRGVQTARGVIGIPDNADPASAVKVTITADGKPRQIVTVAYGRPVTLNLSTAGVLRLGFTFVSATPDANPNVALAGIILSGDPVAIFALGQPTS